MVKISGPNRSAKTTDHFTWISAKVIYCITCTPCKPEDLHTRRNRKKIGGPGSFREHLQDVRKNDTVASKPVAFHFNLPNRTPSTTCHFEGYPYTKGTQKSAKISKKKSSSFNWVKSIHTGSMNASCSTNLFTNCHHISTNGKAPPHSHIMSQQHPTIPLFALTKG